MNIGRSFISYMEDEGLGTFGTDLFLGAAPVTAPESIWWVVPSGGSARSKNDTGEKQKYYVLDVYYRSMDQEDVYEKMQAFEETVNSDGCTQLDGYNTLELEATLFPADQDLEAEDRTIGLMQVTVRVYK